MVGFESASSSDSRLAPSPAAGEAEVSDRTDSDPLVDITESTYLDALYVRAEKAYRVARREVFDRMSPGAPIDLDELTEYQRKVLLDLRDVEDEMQSRRTRSYSSFGRPL